jgi:Trk-type K+ transport system membrane component
MINSKLIYKILGQLLFIEAFLLFISLLVALYYQQDDIFAFIVATLTTIGGGLILKWRGHGADNTMSRRDAYLVVSLSWIVFSPPMVTPIGMPRSFTGFLVTFEPSLAINSATSALALMRKRTFITSASSIIW